MVKFESLLGLTLGSVHLSDDLIVFLTTDGRRFQQCHYQDCCESVTVEDICGDVMDVIGTPITFAEEVSEEDPNASESGTWTFYKLGTTKGSITIRWYGGSNGYYSEAVTFEEVT